MWRWGFEVIRERSVELRVMAAPPWTTRGARDCCTGRSSTWQGKPNSFSTPMLPFWSPFLYFCTFSLDSTSHCPECHRRTFSEHNKYNRIMVKVIIILCLFLNKVKNKSYMTILEHAIILVLKYMYLCTLYSIVYIHVFTFHLQALRGFW